MRYLPAFMNTNSIFDDFFDDDFGFLPVNKKTGALKTDIVKKDGKYELTTEIPGCKKEDVKVELENGYLKISASHNNTKTDKDKKGNVIRQERQSGTYSRSFYVGDNYSPDEIKASVSDGELKIIIPEKNQKQKEDKHYIAIE